MELSYVLLLIFSITTIIGLAKLFPLAGEASWKALVPFYNFIIWLKVIKKPWWWLLLLLTPGVNFLMFGIICLLLAKSFNKRTFAETAIAFLFGYLYLPFLAFQKNTQYVGPEDLSKQKPTIVREWTEAIVFAVVAATVIRTFFFEAFTIPTSSLEKSMMVGDYLFVSKVSYGAKIPNTPLSFPFAHHTLPATKYTKSYIELFKLPYFRLPGLGTVKNNDIVVFNYPDGDTVALDYQNQSYYQICRDANVKSLYNKPKYPIVTAIYNDDTLRAPIGTVIARPPDKRENYVKRCVAVAGDTIQIVDRNVLINGKPAYTAETVQFKYRVRIGPNGISPKVIDAFDITDIHNDGRDSISPYIDMSLPNNKLEQFKNAYGVIGVEPIVEPKGAFNRRVFPHNPAFAWNYDNFGPLYIPKKGVSIALNVRNVLLYKRIIDVYENNDLEVRGDKIIINGEEADTYTFKMNYYWMMGDNRHNSADSRAWGFVPEDHVVGKPVFIWMSIKEDNPYTTRRGKNSGFVTKLKTSLFEDKARRARFFTFVSEEGLSDSYLIHFVVLLGAAWVFSLLRKKKEGANQKK